jgi:hypothetical protein
VIAPDDHSQSPVNTPFRSSSKWRCVCSDLTLFPLTGWVWDLMNPIVSSDSKDRVGRQRSELMRHENSAACVIQGGCGMPNADPFFTACLTISRVHVNFSGKK